ncbi:hypothetical protein AYJ66_17480 [Dietzia cinnamea]|nr:hypothetical protein AYJ66_17480 [Dietzia cinnamea]
MLHLFILSLKLELLFDCVFHRFLQPGSALFILGLLLPGKLLKIGFPGSHCHLGLVLSFFSHLKGLMMLAGKLFLKLSLTLKKLSDLFCFRFTFTKILVQKRNRIFPFLLVNCFMKVSHYRVFDSC